MTGLEEQNSVPSRIAVVPGSLRRPPSYPADLGVLFRLLVLWLQCGQSLPSLWHQRAIMQMSSSLSSTSSSTSFLRSHARCIAHCSTCLENFFYFAPALMIRSVPSSQYASAYRFGAQATREQGDAVLYVNKCSPVSQLVNSMALPSSLPPTMQKPSNEKPR